MRERKGKRSQTTMKSFFFDLSSVLEKAAEWVERNPRAVLAGALVVVTAVMLAQTQA
ncbi:MAG: hypothetical protein IH793_06940, partial [Acidobacteria bacterium]|nr:hypothetical protein [Acidobacteriota bacterium]